MAKGEHQLNAGSPAFHLQQDLVTWKVEKIPSRIAEIAEETGFLTIMGYRCTVFKTPEGDQWAQKSVNVPAEPPKEEKPKKSEKESEKSDSKSEESEDSEGSSGDESLLSQPSGGQIDDESESGDESGDLDLDFSLSDDSEDGGDSKPGSLKSEDKSPAPPKPAPKKPAPKKPAPKKPEILDVPSEEPSSDSDGGSQIASSNRMLRRVALHLARL